MQFSWYGASCFKLIFSETVISTDPFSPAKSGFKNPRINCDAIVFSSLPEDFKKELKKISDETFVVSTPGEIGIKNVFIYGLPHFEGKDLKIIYKIVAENLKICFLGEITSQLTTEEIEKMGEVDILILPVSSKIFSDKKVKETINNIEPKIVIPCCWRKKEDLADLIKEIGSKNIEEVERLKIKKKDLVENKIKLFILRHRESSLK